MSCAHKDVDFAVFCTSSACFRRSLATVWRRKAGILVKGTEALPIKLRGGEGDTRRRRQAASLLGSYCYGLRRGGGGKSAVEGFHYDPGQGHDRWYSLRRDTVL